MARNPYLDNDMAGGRQARTNPYARRSLVDQLGSGGAVGGQGGRAESAADTITGAATSVLPNVVKPAAQSAGNAAAGMIPGAAEKASRGLKMPSGPAIGLGIGGEILGALTKTKEAQPTMGGEFADYTDQFGRRQEGSGGGALSNAATWGGRGAQIGSAIPGIGTAIGGAAGAVGGLLKNAFSKNAPTANTDFRNEDAAAAIGAMYRNELGRDATPEEIAAHLQAQGSKAGDRWVGEKGLFDVLGAIRNSPEAQAYATRGETVNQLGTAPPGQPASSASEPVASARGRVDTGITPPDLLAGGVGGPGGTASASSPGSATAAGGGPASGAVPPGWDADKVARGHQSPKYAAREPLVALSQQLQGIPDEAGRKAAAQQAITAMIPQLEAAGAKVLEVKNEKALIDANDGKGPLWIDMIRDIEGEASPQWIEPDQGGGEEAAGGAPAGPGMTADPLAALGGGDVIAQIMAEIKRIQGGQPDRSGILAGLGG